MKKFRNIALFMLVLLLVVIVGACGYYKYQMSPVSKSSEVKSIDIPMGSSIKKIASILKENNLIRNEKMFLIYIKLSKISDMKSGYYEISQNTKAEDIIKILREGSKVNPNEIEIGFKVGVSMRIIAQTISDNTNNSYDDVISKSNDVDYINTLINKYWFITDEVLNDSLYYKLEGYLYPDKYRFINKDVSVETIFNKMLDRMNEILTPYKEDIENSNFTVHEILTLASMVEKESGKDADSSKIAGVFINRINKNMSLGSDVTTRYALKIDDNKKALSKVQFATRSLYNTRLTDGSMDGKLPVGPISSIKENDIKASLYPDKHNYLYFVANINTKETFFFEDSSSFNKKAEELKTVNQGL